MFQDETIANLIVVKYSAIKQKQKTFLLFWHSFVDIAKKGYYNTVSNLKKRVPKEDLAMELNRRDYILKLIVELFIKTAQPVSSQSLIETGKLDYSSATIRSEMNTLEKMGLLEKTHTSSGRVPSNIGYQYYIDNLRNRTIDEQIKHQLQLVLDQKMETVEQVINKAGEILANMTDLVSVILGPKASSEYLVSFQLVPISKTSVTAIFVTDRGFVENKTFVLDDEVSVDDLKKSMDIIAERVKGTRVDQLVEKMESIRPVLTDFVVEHEVIYQALLEAVSRFQDDRLSYYGEEKLLELPGGRKEIKKYRERIKVLENDTENDIIISIGEENDDVTIMKAELRNEDSDEVEGTIALIGPKRMDYEKAVNSLEYVLDELKERQKKEKEKKKEDRSDE